MTEDALSETGYEHYRTTRPVTVRDVSVLGIEKRVEVTNAVAEYDRAIDLGSLGLGRFRAAVCAVLTTPRISYLGQTFNPVGEMSADELAATVQRRYENLRDLTASDSFSTSVLRTTTDVTQYDGTAVLVEGGVEVEVTVLIAEAVAHCDDSVLGMAVYPRFLDERGPFQRLLAGVTH